MKQILVYGALGGVLITLLKFIEYEHFVQTYRGELYGGLVAIIFTIILQLIAEG